jgi:hypothetical protein
MTTEVQTQAGRCSTHGIVQATREVPRFRPDGLASAVCAAVAVTAPVPAVKASIPIVRVTQ